MTSSFNLKMYFNQPLNRSNVHQFNNITRVYEGVKT
jgi:hypothetical protein